MSEQAQRDEPRTDRLALGEAVPETFLRDLRHHQNLSVTEVAERLKVHPNSVLRWERRQRLPGPLHVTTLACVLQVETSLVVSFFDEMRPAPVQIGIRGVGLRAVRRSAGVPVRRLATAVGVMPSTVYNWEAGRVRVPHHHLPALAATLGLRAPGLADQLSQSTHPSPHNRTSELRRLRRRTGLTQRAVAERIGTSRYRVGTWERGDVAPPLWAIRRLARIYGAPTVRVARAARVPPPTLLDMDRWSPGDLPAVLRALREWCGLTQRALSDRCGCHASSVRAWERGRVPPAARKRVRLEELYGLPRGALLAAYPAEARAEAAGAQTRPTRPSGTHRSTKPEIFAREAST